MPFKAVVFDLGGVILSYKGLRKVFQELATEHGITVEAVRGCMSTKEPVRKERSLFHGTISAQELEEELYHTFAKEKYNLKAPLNGFERWVGPDSKIDLNDCMLDAIDNLRAKGYKIALLTNNFYVDKEKKWNRTPVDLSLFDVIVESAIEGEIKPEPPIYEITQHRLGDVDPADVVFLDDMEENLVYPRQMGWTCIKVDTQNPQKAVDELNQLLEL